MTAVLKYGRRPPKNAPALMFANFHTGTAPAHPLVQDNLSKLQNWQMLLNDRIGDCVVVTWSNFRRLMTSLSGQDHYITSDDVLVKLYQTQNANFKLDGDPNIDGPGSPADGGMDIQTLLEYLHTNGGPDGVKPLAFAKVDYTKIAEVEAAIAIFGGLWIGIKVQNANMDDFNNNKPWNYHPGSADDGGHSILGGGYVPNIKFITWAQETEFTSIFWHHQVEEAWCVVWPENLGTKQFLEGVDQSALANDYQQLTGRQFPAPQPPTPQPVPSPEPVVDQADQTLASAAYEWLQHAHSGMNAVMAQRLYQWLVAKNLIG